MHKIEMSRVAAIPAFFCTWPSAIDSSPLLKVLQQAYLLTEFQLPACFGKLHKSIYVLHPKFVDG